MISCRDRGEICIGDQDKYLNLREVYTCVSFFFICETEKRPQFSDFSGETSGQLAGHQ
jgi:hypothetical protein